MAFIKCRIDNLPDNQVRLKLMLGKRTLRSAPVNIADISEKDLMFAFRRRDVTLEQCHGGIELIRKNEVCDIGSFEVNIT